ncbi:hypothetical protein F4804DRAFT_120471 [Jackrogersella minutella]|nr:hypothetical protein F4804DRAFT_120471 [Jackrogersella minutella]
MLILRVIRRAQSDQLRCNIRNIQNAVSHKISPRQNFRISGLRFESTAPKPSTQANTTPPPQKFAFPERFCVYHAGTVKITFLACLKISTLFIFVFFGFVVTPAYYDREGLSPTVLRTTLSALIPLLFVSWTTSPFVSFIHLRLPPFARQSPDMLRRWAARLPPHTELDITTMSAIAKPRVSRVRVADLREVRRRMGIVNLARDAAAENAARKWYRFRAVADFAAQGNTAARAPWVWEGILDAVRKRGAVKLVEPRDGL